MAVVIGADFQMFVLWKEARDPFNPSHFTRGKGCSSHVTAVGAPKGGETHQWWAFSVLFSERWNMGLFIYFYFYFATEQKRFEVWIVLAYFLPLLTETEGSCCATKGHLVYSQICFRRLFTEFLNERRPFKKKKSRRRNVSSWKQKCESCQLKADYHRLPQDFAAKNDKWCVTTCSLNSPWFFFFSFILYLFYLKP